MADYSAARSAPDPHGRQGELQLETQGGDDDAGVTAQPELAYHPEQDLTSDDLPAFDIELNPSGDAGSSFRTQNDPSSPYQRSNYIERRGAVDVRCSCLDVVHGLYSSASERPATLVVLLFRFDPRKRARRCLSANISLEFSGMKPGEAGPEVYAISPQGSFTLNPTQQHEERKHSMGLEAGGAAPFGGLTATASMGWEKTVARDTSDHTSVTGSIDLKGRNWGDSNCASWTLRENGTTKTGVPALMRAAVLLRRKDDSTPFQCVVKIDAEFDLASRVERVFGGKGRMPKDDSVLFDPEIESTNNLRTYDASELGAVDLNSLCDVAFAKVFTTTGLEKKEGDSPDGGADIDRAHTGFYSVNGMDGSGSAG